MGLLEGRVALVTGASRGIGEAIARRFADEGAAVAVTARTEQQRDERLPGTIHDTVASIREAGGTAIAIRADLAQPEERTRLVDDATNQLGPPDILVNNAAVTWFLGTVYGMVKAAIERFSTGLAAEVYDDGIAVNALSPSRVVATPGVMLHRLIPDGAIAEAEPVDVMAEAALVLCSGDPKAMTGRIDYSQELLSELGHPIPSR
jgi:NAD(P)-dependent dehydrogenase (short-subunit alcohol dehydrogenase family)